MWKWHSSELSWLSHTGIHRYDFLYFWISIATDIDMTVKSYNQKKYDFVAVYECEILMREYFQISMTMNNVADICQY